MTVLATISAIIAVCFAGIVGIILVSGLVRWINAKSDQRAHGSSVMDDEVLERLAQIECRLTDTQDVMLALSDKSDRWEQEPSAPAVGSTGNV
ncbi:MAG: hypothetical protein VX948_09870 [Candidatus Latescibacterota bacterium]|nr:hypothetical protein [Candidatus Latescibacterota bacterium]